MKNETGKDDSNFSVILMAFSLSVIIYAYLQASDNSGHAHLDMIVNKSIQGDSVPTVTYYCPLTKDTTNIQVKWGDYNTINKGKTYKHK